MGFDHRTFRDALGHFPTGVVVVTAPMGEKLDPIAMSVSSFNAVSLDPPLVLFSVANGAASLPGLSDAPHYAISVLMKGQQELSSRFARTGSEKWAGLAPSFSDAGCPGIGPCLARFECTPYATYDGGDHRIFVGHVTAFEIAPEGEPLVFFRGRYHALQAAA